MFIRKIILKKKGFTLIELMLVTSIGLVLMGFMIPKFSTYYEKVKDTKAINIAKQIEAAAMASYGDNNGNLVVDDIVDSIKTLTSLESATVTPLTGSKSIEVGYSSDENNYTLTIDVDTNIFTVEKSENDTKKQIFPKP